MSSDGFLTTVIAALARALTPLADAAESPEQLAALLARLGWPAPAGTDVAAQLAAAAAEIGALANHVEAGASAVTLVADVAGAMSALAALHDAGPLSSAGAPFDDPAFWDELPEDLLGLLVSEALQADAPGLYGVLSFLGVLRTRAIAANQSTGRSAYKSRTIDWAALVGAVAAPDSLMADVYGWGTTFDHVGFLEALAALGSGIGSGTVLLPLHPALTAPFVAEDNPDRGVMKQLVVLPYVAASPTPSAMVKPALFITAIPPAGSPSAVPHGLLLSPVLTGSAQATIGLLGGATLTLTGEFQASPVRVALRPRSATLESAAASLDVEARVDIEPPAPIVLGGVPDGTRLELARAHLAFSAKGSASHLEVEIDAGFDEARAVLDLAEADGFIRGLLGTGQYELSLAFDLAWSTSDGLRFSGSAAPEITLPVNLVLAGVLTIYEIRLALGPGEIEGAARLTVTASGSMQLGPLAMSFDHLGVEVETTAKTLDAPGNFGLLDVALGFKPPDGFGLAIDAGGVSGGGYLYIDRAAGEYAGVLQLQILSVGVSAVALVETKLPGGGFSMFFALFIELPSIPLGFGFTLTGVGGVSGINRTLDVEALQSAVRAGALDSVLFPANPIADAPVIIDTFQAIFPSAIDRYVFGPVVRIGWGVPTLIEAEVGIVISVPDPITIAVLGSVAAVLPTEELDLVALHIDVAGVIDMAAATLSIDASLHDSRIACFALSGDMALRAAFGDQPSFLMALGGFHPGFLQPAGFPTLARLSLAIDAGDFLEIRFDCYFAIASNSLQFGSAFELTADVEGFGINGGTEFDALITLAPFSLDTHVGLHIAITGAGFDLAGAWLDADLTGPNPWYVVGSATIKVLGLEQSIKVDQRIGSTRAEPPPPAEDVVGQLRAALARREAWSVGAAGGAGVLLAADDPASDELVVAPDGTLGVSQRIVPLGIQIDKSVPWQIVGGYNWFDVEPCEASMTSTGSLTDWFAPSSYADLSPKERLSAPSFELLKSGIEFGGGDPISGPSRAATLEYEQIVRDPELDEEATKLDTLDLAADPRVSVISGAATAPSTAAYAIAADNNPVTVEPMRFVAADQYSGVELARRRSWTATRLSPEGRNPDARIAPSWEIPA